MSLNGLDSPPITEAREAVNSEPGGWFLLKYASRDEIELLDHGTGGIVELRNTLSSYEEPSPLYGFLKYRRRNVILKFQPEDCSRLVQARAAVHFTAVCEKLAPYSTTFEISVAKDLKDSKLSSACSLHTASGSSSSSTSSLRRRRLMEITEEEEEEERERKRQSIVQEEKIESEDEDEPPSTPILPDRPVVLDKESPSKPNFASTVERPSFEGVRPASRAKSDCQEGRRLSSQSLRPELYSYSSYMYSKPKVKLGPRPSLDTSKRPQTAATVRPVAALPAGFKLASRGSKREKSRSQDAAGGGDPDVEASTIHVPVVLPEIPLDPDTIILAPRPNTSSGASMKSMPAKDRITPEKARLMKAMKLREAKKKLMASSRDPSPLVVADGEEETIKTAPSEQTAAETVAMQDEDDSQLSVSQVDSTGDAGLSTPLTVDTEIAAEDGSVDSQPPSPTIASSEIDESTTTKASSLSDSTDETVQATKYEESDAEDERHEAPEMVDEIATVEEAGPVDSKPLEADPIETGDLKVDDKVPEAQDGIVLAEEAETTAPAISPEAAQISLETRSEAVVSAPAEAPAEEANSTPELADSDDVEPEPVADQTVERDETADKHALKPLDTTDLLQSSTDSVKAPYGIPLSKFASSDSKQSPVSTPSLKSKFSLQDLRAPYKPIPPLPTVNVVGSPPTAATARFESQSLPRTRSQQLNIQPNEAGSNGFSPESELSDPLLDDELMDELQAATVQEAHPIMVQKSPNSPAFSSATPSPRPQTHGGYVTPPMRSATSPMKGPMLAPADISSSSARRVSAGGAAFIHNINRTASSAGLAAKKGMGSGISQRIKALEQLSSSKTANLEEVRPRTATSTSSFKNARKSAGRDVVASSIAAHPGPLNRQPQTLTPERSREVSPELTASAGTGRQRSGSLASRLSVFESGTQQPPRGRPADSIQVTARIIRDPNQSLPKRPGSRDPSEYNTADLKESPLTVDHVKAEPEPVETPMPGPDKLPVVPAPKETIQERRRSRDKGSSVSEDEGNKIRRRSSLSIVKDFIKERRSSVKNETSDTLAAVTPATTSAKDKSSRPPSAHQNNGNSTRRLSVSSRSSSVSRDRENPTPVMSPSSVVDHSSDDTDMASLNEKTKSPKSRTSRFMRRLSNSLGPARKTLSPNTPTTVREEDEGTISSAASPTNSQPSVTAYMGDVNVQFPDNLLWKRRSLCLDAKGYLLLSAVQGAAVKGTEKSGMKRYHLSDFRLPYIPDVDVQELPNSICLDFVQGSGLQFACEDRLGQKYILETLQESYRNHASIGE